MYALRVIYDYAMRQIDICVEPGEFMNQYGIPDWMLDDTKSLFKKNDDLVF
ncbi:hypothetical protein PT285_03020 [Lactobacillus sp. ESL0791]|uniref:hypothetical protein n=1 Tax=Lactobacillus sp. ESL0791 TaxID=2983234 RepID=UPI0023F80282|nr:hypothetical protein [Lactobacillus sp. ESL0791]MDF7638406.1 hypothetical protein [Lactobacillus sp. ESL0791]